MNIDFAKANRVYTSLVARIRDYDRQATQARRSGEREDAQELSDLSDNCAGLANLLKKAITSSDAASIFKLLPSIKALLGPVDLKSDALAAMTTRFDKTPDVVGTYVAIHVSSASNAHLNALKTLLQATKVQPSDAQDFYPHATVMYSPEHNATSLGKLKYELADFARKNFVTAKVKNAAFLGKNNDALVLKLEPSPELQWLRDLCVSLGMKPTWPDFTPHVTLAYDLIVDDASRAELIAKTDKLVKELDLEVVMFSSISVEDIQ